MAGFWSLQKNLFGFGPPQSLPVQDAVNLWNIWMKTHQVFAAKDRNQAKD